MIRLESVESDSIWRHPHQLRQVPKAAGLRLRNTVEHHILGYVLKQSCRIKMTRQMQSGQHRNINLGRPRPETAGHVMHQIERAAFNASLPDERDDRFLMLAVAAIEVVIARAWFARGEELAAHP